MVTKLSNQLCTESKELLNGNLLKNLLVLPLSREKNPSTAFLFPKVSYLYFNPILFRAQRYHGPLSTMISGLFSQYLRTSLRKA